MTVVDNALGRVANLDPRNFSTARAVGISADSVPAGALCRVVSKGPATLFTGLTPGVTYYASYSGGHPVVYSAFATAFETSGDDGAYLVSMGKALNETTLSVNLSPAVFIASDSADIPADPLTLTASIAPTSPAVNDTLTVTSSTGGGEAPIVTTFQWYQKLGVITGWVEFSGATSSTFVIPGDRQGWSFKCEVTATSNDGQVAVVMTNETQPASS